MLFISKLSSFQPQSTGFVATFHHFLRYADGFTPKYEVYFTACIPARLNDKDRLEDMNHILENVDGIHLDTISIESSYRKTQEGKHDRKSNRNP